MGAIGDALIITNTVAFAIYVVFQEYLSKLTGNSQQVLLWAVIYAAMILIVFSLLFRPIKEWVNLVNLPFVAWLPVIYAGVIGTAFTYGFVVMIPFLIDSINNQIV